ncbi:MAG: hypothetical protein ACHQJ6_07265 [Candidatus Berkiellales bacterium]
MISLDDFVALSELSADEIEAIAEVNHEPVVLTVARCESLLTCKEGICTIKQYLIDDMTNAKEKGDKSHLRQLKKTIKAFEKAHPG